MWRVLVWGHQAAVLGYSAALQQRWRGECLQLGAVTAGLQEGRWWWYTAWCPSHKLLQPAAGTVGCGPIKRWENCNILSDTSHQSGVTTEPRSVCISNSQMLYFYKSSSFRDPFLQFYAFKKMQVCASAKFADPIEAYRVDRAQLELKYNFVINCLLWTFM